MAYTYVQKAYGFSGNVATWQQATGAGNLLVLVLAKANNTGEYVASAKGNVNTSQTWVSAVGTINNIDSKVITSSGSANLATATLLFLPGGSNAGGDTTTTLTLNADAGGSISIGAMEFSGLDSSNPFVNYSLNAQTNPGTGTDATTSGLVNVSSVPALLAGFMLNTNGGGTSSTGTGFAGRGLDAASGAYIWGEDKRITASGNNAATFTDAVATDFTLAIGMAFKETGGGSTQKNQGFFADTDSGLYLPKPKHVAMFMPLAWVIGRRNKLRG